MENVQKRIKESLAEFFGIYDDAHLSAADNGKINVDLPHFGMKFLFCPNNNTLA